MSCITSKKERLEKELKILWFIFKFKFATKEDLDLFGSCFLNHPHMRRTIENLLKKGFIKSFDIRSSIYTIGYCLKPAGVRAFLERFGFFKKYKYAFNPIDYGELLFDHRQGLIKTFFAMAKHNGIWTSEWMVRKDYYRGRKIGGRSRSRRRLPDAIYKVPDGDGKIDIEFERTQKSLTKWESMIEDLKRDIWVKDHLGYNATLKGKWKRTIQAVLFVFEDKSLKKIYQRNVRVNYKIHVLDKLEKKWDSEEMKKYFLNDWEDVYKRFFFATIEDLKEDFVYDQAKKQVLITDLFKFADSDPFLEREKDREAYLKSWDRI